MNASGGFNVLNMFCQRLYFEVLEAVGGMVEGEEDTRLRSRDSGTAVVRPPPFNRRRNFMISDEQQAA